MKYLDFGFSIQNYDKDIIPVVKQVEQPVNVALGVTAKSLHLNDEG